MSAYDSVHRSGEDWIGDAPTHWSVVPLKTLAEFVNGAAFKPSEWDVTGTPIIRIQNLNGGSDFNFYAGEVAPRHHVAPGALLFGWSGNRGTSFGPFIWQREGLHFLNQHIFKVVGIRCHKQWLYWCLKAVTEYVEQEAHGIIGMVHVTKGRLSGIKAPLPSPAEQAAIAAFLDRETGKIDALVEAQTRLIALLKEKRQAVISDAVTKGLAPAVPMKDSGVKGLGQVPAHWEVTALKRFCSRITDGAHISPETENGVYCFVSTRDVSHAGIDFEGCLRTSEASYEYLLRTGCKPEIGDVLFSKDGTIGRTVVVREQRDFVVASSLIIMRPDVEILDADFLDYLCQSDAVQYQVESFVKGAGLPRLSITNLTRVTGIFPPRPEQIEIASHLAKYSAQFSALVAEAEATITLLQERRAALISAAVTGKIDVRGLAPEQAEAA